MAAFYTVEKLEERYMALFVVGVRAGRYAYQPFDTVLRLPLNRLVAYNEALADLAEAEEAERDKS